jgi:UrcA family protein
MERVGQADLDLGSIAGRAKLEQRLRWAATRVCSDYERPAPAGRLVDSRCFRATMKSAVQQMDQAIANQASKRKIGVASIKE